MKVGFIGMGRMGQGMARRVLDAGNDLVVYNRTPSKAEDLRAAGATVVDSIAAVTQDRDAVITMVTDDAAIEAIALGEGGLITALPDGGIHLAMGTHSVAMTRAIAASHSKANQVFVAAPVLGRPDRAAAGELGIMPAGPADAVARLQPLLEVMGRRIFPAGDQPEAAAAIKIAHNFILGCAIEVMGEGMSLVRKYGVEPLVLHQVLTEGIFGSPAYQIYGDIIVNEAYDNVGFTTLIGLKDANLALAAAEAVQVPLPSVNVWRDRLLGAIAHGDGERDWAVVAREQARASGLE
ncbi:MAG: NAD(P)-dependent oxidoreductase [Alphaproteobacteria bacterium]|nr:NAD(P)-dependent oxidoreductase [Alphaproteobacteria bacterium]